MHSSTPNMICDKAIQKPPNIIHITFIIVLRHPDEFSVVTTRLPKGHMASIPSFRVCNPNGMPTIVTINARLPKIYSRAIAKPPNTSQIKLQMVFIIFLSDSNNFYFYQSSFWEIFYCESRAGRKRSAELGCIHFVHGSKVSYISK